MTVGRGTREEGGRKWKKQSFSSHSLFFRRQSGGRFHRQTHFALFFLSSSASPVSSSLSPRRRARLSLSRAKEQRQARARHSGLRPEEKSSLASDSLSSSLSRHPSPELAADPHSHPLSLPCLLKPPLAAADDKEQNGQEGRRARAEPGQRRAQGRPRERGRPQ